jgi:hypothetical protein
MTTPGAYGPGERIDWVDLMAAGLETPRRGEVWDVAPPLPGIGRAYWVLPTDGKDSGRVVLVAVTTRRHRAGVGVNQYHAGRGRWIDRGENYREPRSDKAIVNEYRVERLTPRPTKIAAFNKPSQADAFETEWFVQMCERLDAGE